MGGKARAFQTFVVDVQALPFGQRVRQEPLPELHDRSDCQSVGMVCVALRSQCATSRRMCLGRVHSRFLRFFPHAICCHVERYFMCTYLSRRRHYCTLVFGPLKTKNGNVRALRTNAQPLGGADDGPWRPTKHGQHVRRQRCASLKRAIKFSVRVGGVCTSFCAALAIVPTY